MNWKCGERHAVFVCCAYMHKQSHTHTFIIINKFMCYYIAGMSYLVRAIVVAVAAVVVIVIVMVCTAWIHFKIWRCNKVASNPWNKVHMLSLYSDYHYYYYWTMHISHPYGMVHENNLFNMHLFIWCAVLEVCMLLSGFCISKMDTHSILNIVSVRVRMFSFQYSHFINKNDNNALDTYRVWIYMEHIVLVYVWVQSCRYVVDCETNSNCKKHTMCLVPHWCAYGSCYSNILI